jgi:hypothetical protein
MDFTFFSQPDGRILSNISSFAARDNAGRASEYAERGEKPHPPRQ